MSRARGRDLDAAARLLARGDADRQDTLVHLRLDALRPGLAREHHAIAAHRSDVALVASEESCSVSYLVRSVAIAALSGGPSAARIAASSSK